MYLYILGILYVLYILFILYRMQTVHSIETFDLINVSKAFDTHPASSIHLRRAELGSVQSRRVVLSNSLRLIVYIQSINSTIYILYIQQIQYILYYIYIYYVCILYVLYIIYIIYIIYILYILYRMQTVHSIETFDSIDLSKTFDTHSASSIHLRRAALGSVQSRRVVLSNSLRLTVYIQSINSIIYILYI